MEKIPPEIIQAVIEGTDIVEVISGFVPLRRAGANYVACCPFHAEKTPSFSVSPTKRIFKCFGCGEGGNVIHFLMKHQQRSFIDVMKELGDRLGISVLDDDNTGLGFQYKLLSFAMNFYVSHLRRHRAALDYIADRGVTSVARQEFSIGYAPDAWDELFRAVRQQFGHLEADVLEKSGLFSKSSRGNWIDRFRDRIMFPILDKRARPVGFGGRIFRSADQGAKYLNSPDTPLFDKGRLLFNYHRALAHRDSSADLIIVEGYLDVIGLFQAGFYNVAAPLGTGFTVEQLRLLEKDFHSVYLVFDGDSAGSQATFRAIERFVDSAVVVRSVCLPSGSDPFDFVRQQGKEAFLRALQEAKEALRFYCEQIFLKYPLSELRTKRQAYATILDFFRRLNPLLLPSSNRINQSELIEFLENSFQVSEKVIREQFFAGIATSGKDRIEQSMAHPPASPLVELGARLMIRLSLQQEWREFFLSEIDRGFLEEEILIELYDFLATGQSLLPLESLLSHASAPLSRYLSALNWGEDVIAPFQERAEFLHFLQEFGVLLFQEKIDALSKILYAADYADDEEKGIIFQKRELFRSKKTEWIKRFLSL